MFKNVFDYLKGQENKIYTMMKYRFYKITLLASQKLDR